MKTDYEQQARELVERCAKAIASMPSTKQFPTDTLETFIERDNKAVAEVLLLELNLVAFLEKFAQLERELNEVKAEISNIETHLEVHQCRTIRSPHMDVLHAVQERAQWCTMAQELAEQLYRWSINDTAKNETISRFNELNAGGTPVSPHLTVATAIARYAKHRYECPMSQVGLTEANQCQCGLSSLLKQLE